MRPGLVLSSLALLGCGPAPAAPGEPAGSAAVDAAGAPVVHRDARFEVRETRDVVYGRTVVRDGWSAAGGEVVDLTLDVFEPVGAAGPRPAVLCVPGGGFAGSLAAPDEPVLYSRRQMAVFARHFAARGFVAFSVRYRLAGDHGASPAGWPEPPLGSNAERWRAFYPATRDVKAALRFVHANAGRYGLCAEHVAVIGGSGGGAIAVALASADPDDFAAEIPDDPTAADVTPGGRTDVHAAFVCWASGLPARALTAYDGRERLGPEDAPLVVVHGRDDVIVPFGVGERLRDAWAAASVPVEMHAFDGGHASWDVRIDGRSLPELAFDAFVRDLGLDAR